MRVSRADWPLLAVMSWQAVLHSFLLTHAAQVGLVTIPYLLNRGGTLYGDVLEHRAPLLAWALAVGQRLTQTDPAQLLRALDLALILGISVGVYVLAHYLTGRRLAAVVAVGVWAWWSPSYGNILFYYDSVLGAVLLATAAAWVFTRGWGWFLGPLLAGLLLGMAVMVKQHGGAAVVLFGVWLVVWGARQDLRWRSVLVYGAAVMVVPLMVVAYQAAVGNLANFIYWTVTFNLSGDVPPLPPTSAFVYKTLLASAALPAFVLFTVRSPAHRAERTLLLLLAAAGAAALIPKAGEIHLMAALPLTAVMTGWVAADVIPSREARRRRALRDTTPAAVGLAGVGLAVLAGWLWAGLLPLVPTEAGRGATIAYDEFEPVAGRLTALADEGDTLFVLPALDGNAQLHLLTSMKAPATWTTTHDCMLCAPGLTERLLAEWTAAPPTYVVLFPALLNPRQNIEPLLAFVEAGYELVEVAGPVPFNGEAHIYRFAGPG